MTTVEQVLAHKAPGLHTTTEDCPVESAISDMARLAVHSLLVMRDHEVVGIFTDRDYVHKIVVPGLDPTVLKVADVMTRNVVFISPQATITSCVEIMNEGKFRHLPVREDGKLLGMISMTDIMRAIVNGADGDIETYI